MTTIDPAQSAITLATAKSKFLDGLKNIADDKALLSLDEVAEIRSNMTDEDNDKLNEYIDQETVIHHDHILDTEGATPELRTAITAYIEDSFLKVTGRGSLDSEERIKILDKLSPDEALFMMQFIKSEVAECIMRQRMRTEGLDPAKVVEEFYERHKDVLDAQPEHSTLN